MSASHYYSYGWEKLHKAVHSLCGSAGQAKRLEDAISFLIQLKPENHLPVEMKDDFEEFMRKMTSVRARGEEGSIRATVSVLGEVALGQAIEKIIGFYDIVNRHRSAH